MAATIYLNPSSWDLAIDANGNIASASEPYALAQDAASACRTFLGECYFDTTIGIPYSTEVLGRDPSIPLLKSYLVNAALTVPDVVSAQAFITEVYGSRSVGGQVQITDSSGNVTAANF